MKATRFWLLFVLLLMCGFVLAGCGSAEESAETHEDTETHEEGTDHDSDMAHESDNDHSEESGMTEEEAMAGGDFTIGLIMVGPKEDHGWNQAHWEGVEYVVEKMGAELVWFDKLNGADNPDLTVEQVVDDLVAQGADLIVTNSAEMADGTNNAAKAYPDVKFVHASGDDALLGTAPENVSNVMGQMEYGKMMAGCAAAMTTETGKIAYLGALIDSETRRLVNSTYLGAKHCWETVRGNDPADLNFEVIWIGFWFEIPGFTLSPTQVVNDFFDGGADVVVSGIDTTEAVVVAGQRAEAGEAVYAVPYDFIDACDEAPAICLGVPFYNWGPSYLEFAQNAQAGTWEQTWIWPGPDWADLNNVDTSMIGWVDGDALSDDAKTAVQDLIAGMGDGRINLYTGPLTYQDGSEFVADGVVAEDLTLWNTAQLLDGIVGLSAPEESE